MARGKAVAIVLGGVERTAPERQPRRRKFSHGAARRARIALWAADGLNNRAIAQKPGVSRRTVWDAQFCEDALAAGKCDMMALACELLDDPNWPLHAAKEFSVDNDHGAWPVEAGWWLRKRARLLGKLGVR